MNAGFAVFLDFCGFVSAPQFDPAHRNSFSAKFIECGLGILHFKQPRNLAVELLLRLVPILGMRVKRISASALGPPKATTASARFNATRMASSPKITSAALAGSGLAR